MSADVICIGSVLWDVIGRAPSKMRVGSDVPGRITRIPGGVAMNVAMMLRGFDLTPALLTAIGTDPEGDALIVEAEERGLICDYVYRSEDLPTDSYMAIEASNGVIAAIADAHSLEAAGEKILQPVKDGALPADLPIVLDGNLTSDLLASIANDPFFSGADLRVAPASPGKATRLRCFVGHATACLYVNLEEANLIAQTDYDRSGDAAKALVDMGAHRVVVTDGSRSATVCTRDGHVTQAPPAVAVARLTGAGDTFIAAHVAAELAGKDSETALESALFAASTFVSGKTPQ